MRPAFAIVLGLIVAAFGLLCLNYTTDENADYHRERALELGVPPPSKTIFVIGLASTVAGAGAVGFALGRRSG
jgi:hypothetical protein